MRITWQEIRKWGSCYQDAILQQIFGEDGLTPLEIHDLSEIPLSHRRHALVRVLFYRSKTPITDYTGWCALRAYYHAESNPDDYRARSLSSIVLSIHHICLRWYSIADTLYYLDSISEYATITAFMLTDAVARDNEKYAQLDYLVELIGE